MRLFPIYSVFSKVWSIRRIFGDVPAGERWLMYHAVGTDVPDDTSGLYSISAHEFEVHVQWLSQIFSVVARPHLQPSGDRGIQIGITFDDGYRDNLYVAAPILNKYRLPFSVFVIADAVRTKDKRFLSVVDLRRLVSDYDVVIGSHGNTHMPLTLCNDVRLREELVASKHFLEDALGQEVSWISYPHGAVDRRVRAMAEEVGYQYGFTSFFSSSEADPLMLPRLPVLNGDGLRMIEQKIHGDWDWFAWKQRVHQAWEEKRLRSGRNNG